MPTPSRQTRDQQQHKMDELVRKTRSAGLDTRDPEFRKRIAEQIAQSRIRSQPAAIQTQKCHTKLCCLKCSLKKRVEKLHYMHMNPLKRNLVDHPKDWPWSNFSFYSNPEHRLIRVDRVN